MYEAIKHVHVFCVTVSAAGFFLRGILMALDSPLLQQRWIRRLPHVIDSVLLAAAIALVVLSGQYPFVHAWVTAKIFGLIAYVVLGSIALKYGRTKSVRVVAWFAAMAVFGNLVAVALTKSPWGLVRLVGG